LGNEVELTYDDRRKTLQKVSSVVIHEEQMRHKKGNEPALDKEQQLRYITKWKKMNEEWLNSVFGIADGPQLKFITGTLFVTSSSKHIISSLDVIRLRS